MVVALGSAIEIGDRSSEAMENRSKREAIARKGKVRAAGTGAGPLLGELIDEDRDSKGVDGLCSDEEVVVVVNDEAEEDEGRHARDHAEERLHLGRLPPHPCCHGVDRLLCSPHRDAFPRGDPVLESKQKRGRIEEPLFSASFTPLSSELRFRGWNKWDPDELSRGMCSGTRSWGLVDANVDRCQWPMAVRYGTGALGVHQPKTFHYFENKEIMELHAKQNNQATHSK
ncbi:hypothetical protein C4D60_Mb07t09860 [Musa balbisiana]|uniref:Uncharacterized protein n=1 Tax=Musa balbisiana TaxID=52838 RepID=A0A4S8JES0_MUSBA|nr:hypothetical protein C4D60_Mb07t09860 [Musa balbisiana]